MVHAAPARPRRGRRHRVPARRVVAPSVRRRRHDVEPDAHADDPRRLFRRRRRRGWCSPTPASSPTTRVGRWAFTSSPRWLTFQGLIAPLGEFSFGVPQFQQIFHPMILVIASAFAFVAIRLVLGPVVGHRHRRVQLGHGQRLARHGQGPRRSTTKTLSALRDLGASRSRSSRACRAPTNRMRFAIASGVGVATLGLRRRLLVERQPRVPAVELQSRARRCGLRARRRYCLGRFLPPPSPAPRATRTAPRRLPRPLLAVAGVAMLVCLAIPMPRHTGDVTAAVRIVDRAGGYANVACHVDAAERGRRTLASSKPGRGKAAGSNSPTCARPAEGHYVSEDRIPVYGKWKALLRLHRGGEMMTVPLYLPGDPEINKPEIPAVNRTMAFQPEPKYLLREQHGGNAVFENGIYALARRRGRCCGSPRSAWPSPRSPPRARALPRPLRRSRDERRFRPPKPGSWRRRLRRRAPRSPTKSCRRRSTVLERGVGDVVEAVPIPEVVEPTWLGYVDAGPRRAANGVDVPRHVRRQRHLAFGRRVVEATRQPVGHPEQQTRRDVAHARVAELTRRLGVFERAALDRRA